MMALLLGCVLYRFVHLGGWILVGVSSCNTVVSILVESSKGVVCSIEAECSAFLFHVVEASGISIVGKFHLVDDDWAANPLAGGVHILKVGKKVLAPARWATGKVQFELLELQLSRLTSASNRAGNESVESLLWVARLSDDEDEELEVELAM
ncbi:hypothetical protein V6N13_110498 [Hibiscus sabdariffa]